MAVAEQARRVGAAAFAVVALFGGLGTAGCAASGSDRTASAPTSPPSSTAVPERVEASPPSTSTTMPDRRRRWEAVVFCTSLGSVRLELPGPVRYEGPRSLLRLPEPANGTFAFSIPDPDRALRYDASLIDDAQAHGPEPSAMLQTVVRQIDALPEEARVWATYEDAGLERASFVGANDGRVLVGEAYAAGGVVLAVSVGTFPGEAAPVLAEGQADLERIVRSVRFPADAGGGVGSCVDPPAASVPDAGLGDEPQAGLDDPSR